MVELEPEETGGPWMWLTIGCGSLLLLGACLLPPALLFVGGEDEWLPDPDANPSPNEEPSGSVASPPSPPPLPSPPPVPSPPPSPLPAPPSAVTTRRTVTGRLDHVEGTGLSSLRAGSTCTFDVTQHPRPDGTFWCNAQIECGGHLLYGGTNAGYFDCTLYDQPQRHVVGRDPSTTSQDGDSAMRLDTLRGELEVRDDATGRLGAFLVRGTITGVR